MKSQQGVFSKLKSGRKGVHTFRSLLPSPETFKSHQIIDQKPSTKGRSLKSFRAVFNAAFSRAAKALLSELIEEVQLEVEKPFCP
jgi:hypothetical protein